MQGLLRHALAALAFGAPLWISPFHAHAQLRGHVESRVFTGPITGRPVNFNIYLPEGYADAGNQRRYPVVYHLHGLGGSPNGHTTVVPAAFESALAEGLIGPVIIVFANGYTDSWWADSYAGAPVSKPAETDVARQLIPYVDTNFRTIADMPHRVVQGFSMGGFGATKFYAKFPELFAACVEYDAAYVTWQGLNTSFPAIARDIFNNNESYFNQFSPWQWTVTNAPTLRQRPPLRMVVGALQFQNRAFRTHATSQGIPLDYVETTCAHDLACILGAQGRNSAIFFAGVLGSDCACVADRDCDSGVTIDDLLAYLIDFEAGDISADLDNGSGVGTPDGGVTVDDLLYYLVRFEGGC